jgi:hypothetical protein
MYLNNLSGDSVMKRSRIGLLLVFFLFGISFVSAIVNPVAIVLSNCKIGSVSADCSEYVNVSCNALAQGNTSAFITSVSMSVNGNGYRAALTSGTYMNGTWSYNYQVTKDLQGTPITFQSVSATASDGSSCSAQNNIGSTTNSCNVQFVTPVAAANACVCSYTKATGAITTANTRPFTVTPSAACVDQRVTSYSEFADYCDPQWVPSYGACLGTFANGTQSLSGYTLKTYIAGDGGVCCAATGNNVWFNHNTGSDCTAPIDAGSSISCTEDFWNAGGDAAGFNNITGFNTASYNSYSVIPAGNSFEPLVYDFNGDGLNEIILSSRDKVAGINLWLYSNKLVLLATSSLEGNITGQPALVGITVDANGNTVLESWVSRTQAPILVVPINMGEARIEFINMSGGTFSNMLTKKYAITGSNGTTRVSGVVCDYGTCYFYADNNLLYSYKYMNGTVHAVNWRQTYTCGGTCSWSVPGLLNDWLFVSSSPSIAKISNDSRYIVVPMNFENGVYKNGGLFVVSDLDVFHNELTPVVRYLLAPEYDTMSNQLSWTQVGKVAVSKPTASTGPYGGYTYQVGLSVEETYDSTAPKLKMGVFQFTLDPLGHVATAPFHKVLVSMLPIWKNVRSSTDEGMSDVVALSADKMAVRTSNKIASLSLTGVNLFDYPTLDVTSSTFNSLHPYNIATAVSNDKLYVYLYYGSWTKGHRIQDGRIGIDYQPSNYLGLGSGMRSTYLETSSKKRLFSSFTLSFGSGGQNGYISSNNVDSFFSPTTALDFVQMGAGCWAGTGQWPYYYYVTGPIKISGTNYLLYSGHNASACAVTSNYRPFLVSSSDPKIYYEWRGFSNVVNDDIGRIIAYDSATDVLLTNRYLFVGFKKGFINGETNTTLARATILPSQVSGAAFNFDWVNLKYMGVDGKKYTIDLTTSPPAITGTVTTCGVTFTSLFYNSDAHIMGMNRLYNATVVRTNDHPHFAYCDFSDDGNPKVHTDTTMPMLLNSVTCTQPGGVCTATANMLLVRQYASNDGIYDGVTGEWYLFEGGYTYGGWSSGAGYYNSAPDSLMKLYSMDSTLTAGQNSTISTASTLSILQSGSVVQAVSSGFTKRGFISAGDFNADGTVDIVTPTGSYDLKNLIFTSVPLGLNQEGELAIPVDLNADRYMDVLSVTTNDSLAKSLKAKLTVPAVSSITQGSIAINNMRCSAISGTNKVNVQLTAAALSPDKVTVKIDAGDGSGAITSTPQADGTYSLSYGVSGTYTITATVVDFDSTAASKTCSVTIVIPATVVTPVCGIGADGEFSYSDSVTAHNWKVVKLPVGQTTLKPGSGILTTSSNTEVNYALTSCSYATTVAETKMWPGSSSGFYIYGTDPAKIIGIQFNRGSGSILNQDGEYLDTYPTDSLSHILSISMNRANGEYKLIMDGSTLYTGQLAFEVGGVAIKEGASWDYVRTTTSGAIVDTQKIVKNSSLVGDVTKLMGCNLDNQQNSNSLVVRTGFNNVNQYCISKGASGTPAKCDYIDLAVIATNYPECSKEAYNYCVKNLGSQQVTSGASVQGGTVCSSLFMISAGVTGIVYPTVNAGWNVFKSNITLAFLIVVILIIFLPIIASKRRGL